ncbi:transposase [Saccharopolyspora erythraea]|uniref:IS701 family transposase n=1 Tax=Saccharopolyspora erythraea TaxID=1836 RepID=UPI001BAC2401|nr:transposase [Saccharopolyspora erythraea]QUH02172.1 transposase [Saccharopolyspora erythraea]
MLLSDSDVLIAGTVGFSRFVQEAFASLSRLDQRRWAEVYVRGLLEREGRKSARKIADAILGLPVAQSLQQFVNQSPWDWQPVRQYLAAHAVEHLRPKAWVLDNTVIPKSGRYSVGVARRYVEAERRTLNCQVGKALFLAGDGAGVPVDWRIVLPEKWGSDAHLRKRARIPAEERSEPEWRYALDLVDQQRNRWAGDSLPVVSDVRNMSGAADLGHRLHQSRIGFVFQVGARLPLVQDDGRVRTALDCAQDVIRNRRPAVVWRGDGGSAFGTYFLSVPVQFEPSGKVSAPADAGRSFRLIVERSPNEELPVRYWLTNFPHRMGGEVVGLGRLVDQTRRDLRELRLDFGLHDFEGRSFRGWHHHMTLVSAAYAYHRTHLAGVR